MTTNEITKVDKGVRSRCEVLEVPAVSPELFLTHAKKIFEAEGVSIDEGALYEALEAVYDEKPDNREYYKKLDELFREVGSN
jgi:DNA polymerase III gamma/tau subunit